MELDEVVLCTPHTRKAFIFKTRKPLSGGSQHVATAVCCPRHSSCAKRPRRIRNSERRALYGVRGTEHPHVPQAPPVSYQCWETLARRRIVRPWKRRVAAGGGLTRTDVPASAHLRGQKPIVAVALLVRKEGGEHEVASNRCAPGTRQEAQVLGDS